MAGIRIEPGKIDKDAVAAILSEPIDWRHKGMPAAVAGMTIGSVAERRLRLFHDGFVGPLLVLDGPALEHNLATMAAWCAARGVALAPHGKTTMAPQLFARQLEHGAWGITTATASQLRVYRAFGVSRIMLANQLVDPAALRWLAAELDRDPELELELFCWVDSERGVALMDEALRAAGARRPVDVLVELGGAGGRTGARDLPTAIGVARAAVASPVLRLVGVGGYEGVLAQETTADDLSRVEDYLARLRELTVELAGLFEDRERVIVTAGGSGYFDLVAEAINGPWPDGLPVLPVLRSGAYVTHDDGLYRRTSPLGERPRTDAAPFRSALRAWAQVSSRPTADLALLTMGKRDVPYDVDLPVPQLIRAGGVAAPLPGCRVTKLMDQHAFLAIGPEADPRVGDWVGFGLSHPCTTFDKWQLIPVVDADGETVVDLIRTYF
ncbi:MAG TPA: amino acid deaminase [Actinophytocola sp.]|uniref:amino acid deaminase n=1 Tax=Actinophytocola sp. TaxID=1872138 RepID=UPI002DDD0C2E|nr:amino acid deaminase [Actinophytocola sp.]HEV2782607.1 amino acid deaminase [Actinophytocola sp.]